MYAKFFLSTAVLCYLVSASGLLLIDARDEYPHQFAEPIVLRPVDDKIMSIDLELPGRILLGSSTALEYHSDDFGGLNLAISGGSLEELAVLLERIPDDRELIVSLDGHNLVYGEQRNRVKPDEWGWGHLESALGNPFDFFQYGHAVRALEPRESSSFYDERGNSIREFSYAKSEPDFESHGKKFSNAILTQTATRNLDNFLEKIESRNGNATIILSPVHPNLYPALEDDSYLKMQNHLRSALVKQCAWAQVYDMTQLEFSWELFHDSIHFPAEVGAEVMAYIDAGEGSLC